MVLFILLRSFVIFLFFFGGGGCFVGFSCGFEFLSRHLEGKSKK